MSTANSTSPLPDLQQQVDFLHAYLECTDSIQEGVRDMLDILFDANSSEDEKAMAMHTIADALFPKPYNGKLGMDLEESETDAAAEDAELQEIVQDMDREEEVFAENLHRIMLQQKTTQSELAAKIGVGQPAISMMLNRRCRPQRRTIDRLAKALHVSATDLWPK